MRFTRTLKTLMLAAALLSSAGPAQQSSLHDDEVVVMGRLDNQRDDGTEPSLWDSIFIARLHVTQVLRGRIPSKVLTIKYIAHSERSEDQEFHFHLRRKRDGTYLACGDGGVGFVCP